MTVASWPFEVKVGNDAETEATWSAISLLRYLVESGVIQPDDWRTLPREPLEDLARAGAVDEILDQLLELNALNTYQVSRIRASTVRGLVLGNYRVLRPLGSSEFSVVFEAEHRLMRHKVAIKVLPIEAERDPEFVAQLIRETRRVASLDHPNIVAAMDAGVCKASGPHEMDLYYFVREFLSGQDLEKRVNRGSLAVREACQLIYQIATALDAAHQYRLVHRGINPSSIFITHENSAKLLDFGLVHDPRSDALTTSQQIEGTLDFMAPEQACDPITADIRTDVFGLGASLFYALVGRSPFPLEGSIEQIRQRRRIQVPLRARGCRAEVPTVLDDLLQHMMALRPEERMAPREVMQALAPFLEQPTRRSRTLTPDQAVSREFTDGVHAVATPAVVLIIDHESRRRHALARFLRSDEIECVEAERFDRAAPLLRANCLGAIIVALDPPETDGHAILKCLRDNPPSQNLKIIMATRDDAADQVSALLACGADDVLSLPLADVQLSARVHAVIRHKLAEDDLHRLNQRLIDMNVALERSLTSRNEDVTKARNALVLALARLVEYRSTETLAHLTRVQRYSVVLAQEVASHPSLTGQVDHAFLDALECCAPLHDLGNVGLPDAVLLKAGPLNAEERGIIQTHTVIGADTLRNVAERFGADDRFLRMAIDIARSHHEHYDGSGYPDGLRGADIPLAARIVALADAYDSMRSRRVQRPRLSHVAVAEIIINSSAGKFDPLLVGAFRSCSAQFERVHNTVADHLSVE